MQARQNEFPVRADGLPEALHAAAAFSGYTDELALFGQFVGSWDIELYETRRDGQPPAATGDLHFGWVLGGRAVQDVWRVSGPGTDKSGSVRGFYGSTLRFYDPAIAAWRSTSIEPFHGRVLRFIGRRDGDGILLNGLDEEPRLRWAFRDITPDSFRWTGSLDGGTTWELNQEMFIRRRGA